MYCTESSQFNWQEKCSPFEEFLHLPAVHRQGAFSIHSNGLYLPQNYVFKGMRTPKPTWCSYFSIQVQLQSWEERWKWESIAWGIFANTCFEFQASPTSVTMSHTFQMSALCNDLKFSTQEVRNIMHGMKGELQWNIDLYLVPNFLWCLKKLMFSLLHKTRYCIEILKALELKGLGFKSYLSQRSWKKINWGI